LRLPALNPTKNSIVKRQAGRAPLLRVFRRGSLKPSFNFVGKYAMTESDKWYIARGDQELGPFSVFELKEMGIAGKIEPTDAVWKEGMPNRIPATRVKGLLPTEPGVSDTAVSQESEAQAKTPEQEAEERRRAELKKKDLEVRKRRITGIKGAILLSEDGKEARIRKKCIKCGTEDRSRSTIRILPGASRTTFFCPNCRRVYPVEISGV
jgi:hypothetical protein